MPKSEVIDLSQARGRSFTFTVSKVYPRVIEDTDNDFVTVKDTKGYTYLMIANDAIVAGANLEVEIKGRFTTLLEVL